MKSIEERERTFHNARALKVDKRSLSLSYANRMKELPLVWQKIHGLAFDLCGNDLSGRNILDLGCGAGATTMILSERNGKVTALDVSEEMVCLSLERAKMAGFEKNVEGFSGTIGDLKKSCGQKFDIIFCGAVLHHLPGFDQGIRDIYDILLPGGLMVGYEPMSSIVSDFARKFFPYQGSPPSDDEWQLSNRHIAAIKGFFSTIVVYRFGVFTGLERCLYSNNERLWNILEFLDKVYLKLMGGIFCWHIVFMAKK